MSYEYLVKQVKRSIMLDLAKASDCDSVTIYRLVQVLGKIPIEK